MLTHTHSVTLGVRTLHTNTKVTRDMSNSTPQDTMMTLGVRSQYDDYRNYQNQLRLGAAYKQIAKNPEAAKKNPFFQWPGESWTKKASSQSLAQGFPLANGVVEVRCVRFFTLDSTCAHTASFRCNGLKMIRRECVLLLNILCVKRIHHMHESYSSVNVLEALHAHHAFEKGEV
jgi:hypothetical protein